jgi:hypothetical protein
LPLERRITLPVIFATVLAAICFDNQIKLQTREIRDIRADWFLTLEFESHETSVAQIKPQALFSIR